MTSRHLLLWLLAATHPGIITDALEPSDPQASPGKRYLLTKDDKEYLGFRPQGSTSAFITCDQALLDIGSGALKETQEQCPEEPAILNLASLRGLKVRGVRGGVVTFEGFTREETTLHAFEQNGQIVAMPVVETLAVEDVLLDTASGTWTGKERPTKGGQAKVVKWGTTTSSDPAMLRGAMPGDLVLISTPSSGNIEIVDFTKAATSPK